MIELEQINKVYYTKDVETHALDNISLTIENGEFVSIMGPSGCGKSTLLNIVGLLDNPTSGILRIGGVDVAGMNDRQQSDLRNRKLGFIFQNFHLVPSLTIQGNVELPMNYRRGKLPFDKRKRALEVLDIVGLSHRTKHYPTQLSGGQCQRVAIARALMGMPEIILADEPTGNLDSKMGAEIMEILKRLNHDGVTIVMVTHDEKIAEQTTRIIRFLDGKIINA